MSTSGRVETVVDNGQMSSMINIPRCASISGTNTPPPSAVVKEGDENSGNEGDNTQPSSNSNHGFDKDTATLAPKTAQFLANRRFHGGKSSRSHYGLLDILDPQVTFDGTGIRWNENFQLGVNNPGSSNAVEYDSIQKKVKEMGKEIMFEVFYDRHQNAYVSALPSGNDILAITVE